MLGLEEALAWNDASHRFRSDLLALSSFRLIRNIGGRAGPGPPGVLGRSDRHLPSAAALPQTRLRPEALSKTPCSGDLVADLIALRAALRTDDALPALPPPEVTRAAAGGSDFDVARCCTSPLLKQADLHPPFRVGPRRTRSTSGWSCTARPVPLRRPAHGGTGAALPSRAVPLSGQVSLSADPVRAEQTLRLSWPPNEPCTGHPEAEHADRNAAEARARGRDSPPVPFGGAARWREGRLQLLWLITDIYPAETAVASEWKFWSPPRLSVMPCLTTTPTCNTYVT